MITAHLVSTVSLITKLEALTLGIEKENPQR
ncbi:hypothetical protein NIES4074_10280 [Cylindrospermum sp. NIES-4074]|nr:hypothetical protein NIES4074_10280 [Cylindrospermum sp. NIES-4074]